MKVYIAGPIAGYDDLNKLEFERIANKLIELGHEPINPHDISPMSHEDSSCLGLPTQGGHGYGCYMIPDLKALLDCQGFTLLKNWGNSKGASVEYEVASICGLKYVYTMDW